MTRQYTMKAVENPFVFISWGKGLQSTCLGVMSALGMLPKVNAIITADTQWEHSYTNDVEKFYTQWFQDKGIEVHKVTFGNIQEIDKEKILIPFFTSSGAPLQRRCTAEYKILPIRRKMRELMGLPQSGAGRTRKGLARIWLGITTDEAERMSMSHVNYIINDYPLIDLRMSREDCKKIFIENNLPVPGKSSCVCCPFQGAAQWLNIKKNYPEEWKAAVEFDEKNREAPEHMKKHNPDCKLYLWKKGPLKDADFESIVEKGDNKDVCDSGYCFV